MSTYIGVGCFCGMSTFIGVGVSVGWNTADCGCIPVSRGVENPMRENEREREREDQ